MPPLFIRPDAPSYRVTNVIAPGLCPPWPGAFYFDARLFDIVKAGAAN
jgi:hypothetical protein